ncbi:hypothetical protein D3C84_166730 [compost metagenome]
MNANQLASVCGFEIDSSGGSSGGVFEIPELGLVKCLVEGYDFRLGSFLRSLQSAQFVFCCGQLFGKVFPALALLCGMLRGFCKNRVGRIPVERFPAVGLVEPLANQVCLLNQGKGDGGVHEAAVGGLVAEHPKSVEFLEDGVANNVLEMRRFELFEKTVGRLAVQPQLSIENANQGFREAAKLDGSRVRV